MTKQQAIEKVIQDNPTAKAGDIVVMATKLYQDTQAKLKGLKAYDSLSDAAYSPRDMRYRNISNPVVKKMAENSIAEFMPFYWSTLQSMKEKLVAVEVYNFIRKQLLEEE